MMINNEIENININNDNNNVMSIIFFFLMRESNYSNRLCMKCSVSTCKNNRGLLELGRLGWAVCGACVAFWLPTAADKRTNRRSMGFACYLLAHTQAVEMDN